VATTTIATSAVTITPVTLTDETGFPGVFCIYSGSDLYIDGTHLCQQRTSGAKNWEAWIQDQRDTELYRVVQMPDGHWWTAEEMRYDASAAGKSNICAIALNRTVYCDASVPCPATWSVPTETQFNSLMSVVTIRELMVAGFETCSGTSTDYYGFTIIKDASRGETTSCGGASTCYLNDEAYYLANWMKSDSNRWFITNKCTYGTYPRTWNQARCIR
jgi:uncharacterized protein (TIGR02145 family)